MNKKGTASIPTLYAGTRRLSNRFHSAAQLIVLTQSSRLAISLSWAQASATYRVKQLMRAGIFRLSVVFFVIYFRLSLSAEGHVVYFRMQRPGLNGPRRQFDSKCVESQSRGNTAPAWF